MSHTSDYKIKGDELTEVAESMVTQQERAVGTADEIDEPERLRRSRLVGLLAVCERYVYRPLPGSGLSLTSVDMR